MANVVFDTLPTFLAILLCFFFAVLYVGSLYVWGATIKDKSRDHPDVIKRRFLSVASVCAIAPVLLWTVASPSDKVHANTLLEWLGIRFWGFIPACIVPLFLTMVLFLGPLSLHYLDGVFSLYLESKYWTNSVKNYVWLRNHIVAPLSEEFIFRACMLPVLLPRLGEGWSILLCPLFFGVAHFHHMIEKVVHSQQDVSEAFKQSLFQLGYTTVFGAYSAFLFLRTGHLMAPVIAHAFCNHMGFPSFGEVMGYPSPTRHRLIALFVLGLVSWLLLLYPLTSPLLYSNDVYVL
ncbi:CAAX prenyl protease 2 [Aplysia californica]|uniref:CAAX prenyl protease 2 n=1 Tax=Aplysia californica TaxID=6500 RepID=A0ABM0JAF5_APLCA|nr:CAAX prenyl protease 2 [Aplysia californica]